MKTLIAVLAAFLFVNNSLYPQGRLKEKPDNSSGEDFFSISYDIGYSFSNNSRESRSANRSGQTGGVELALHSSSGNQFFVTIGEHKLISGETYFQPTYLTSVTLGPRIFIFPKSGVFAEASFGPYFQTRYFGSGWGNIGNEMHTPSSSNVYIGVSAGAGKEIKLSNFASLMLKAVLSNIFVEKGHIVILGISSSIQFSNKPGPMEKRLTEFVPHWALTAIAGTNNPDFFVNNLFEWGHSYGIEAARVQSPRMEFYTSLVNYRFIRLFKSPELQQTYPWHEFCLSFSAGEKMYMNDRSISPYLDLGVSAYLFYYLENETAKSYPPKSANPALGVSVGTGIKIRLNKSISIIAGSKGFLGLGLGTSSKSSNDTVSFLSLTSGLRLDF